MSDLCNELRFSCKRAPVLKSWGQCQKWTDLRKAEQSARVKAFFMTKRGQKVRRKLALKARSRWKMYGSLGGPDFEK